MFSRQLVARVDVMPKDKLSQAETGARVTGIAVFLELAEMDIVMAVAAQSGQRLVANGFGQPSREPTFFPRVTLVAHDRCVLFRERVARSRVIEDDRAETVDAVAARAIDGKLSPVGIVQVTVGALTKGDVAKRARPVTLGAIHFDMSAQERVTGAPVIEGADLPRGVVVAPRAV